jgi:AbrB family looped-hinge helix DNA binding protein
MKTTMDRFGRLVVPKAVRKAAGIAPGAALEIRATDGRIEIEAAPLDVKLVKRGRLTVAVPVRPVPPLSQAEVAATMRALRRRGGGRE